MKSKKLLAILLSLALLVGLMPVAGLLTAGAAETDPTVYEISFTEGEKIGLGYYSKKADNAAWVATFDYFLKGNTAITFEVTWSATTSNHTTSLTLEPGMHSATISATCSTAMSPILVAPTGAAGTLYAWNLVMMANDATKNYYVHNPWQCTCGAANCKRTTADVTSAKTLSQYDFESMSKEESVTDPSTTVYEIAFEGEERVSLGYYRGVPSDLTVESTFVWEVTFDYYLSSKTAQPFTFSWGNNGQTPATAPAGSTVLEKGLHTAKFGVTTTYTGRHLLDPKFTAAAGASGTLYVWNLKVVANDVVTAHYVHTPWYCGDCTSKRTNADVTSDKTYGDYDFESMSKEEEEEEETDTTDPNTTVYEIHFTAGEKFDVGYYTNTAADVVWNFTFEYYLDCDSDDPFNFLWVGKDETNITGSYVLQRGRHTATFGATNSTNISPRFTAKTGMSGTLYVWGLKVTLNGADKAYYYHSPWQCTKNYNGTAHSCTRTTADVTSDKTYGDYDFVEMAKDPYTYEATENGCTITVNKDQTVSFADLPYKEIEGALFNGYVDADGNPVTSATVTAGTVLTAQYITNWNADGDGDGNGDNFAVNSTQLREASATKSQALRFVVEMNKSVLANFSSVEYGTVLIPKEILGSAELKLNGVYTYNDTQYNAATVKAAKLYRDTDTSVQFTAALTGIQEKSYATVYAARGYMTYTDLNGVAHTVYSTDTDATSLYEVAQKLVELDPNDAAANAIIKAVEG